MATPAAVTSEKRHKSLEEYRKKLIEHRELDAKLKKSEELVINPQIATLYLVQMRHNFLLALSMIHCHGSLYCTDAW